MHPYKRSDVMANQQKSVSVTLDEIAYIGIYKVSSNFVITSYGKYHKSLQRGAFDKEQEKYKSVTLNFLKIRIAVESKIDAFSRLICLTNERPYV